MSAQDRMAAWAASLGTAQDERADPALRPEHAPLDDRSAVQMLQAAQALARLLRFYRDDDAVSSGDWSAFLPAGDAAALQAMIDRQDGQLAPHHALLVAFIRMGRHAQEQINAFGERHLQHQMQGVLGSRSRPATPDRAHLVVQLKKGAAALEAGPAQVFSAGKDALKVDQRYTPVRPVVLGHAQVQALAVVARSGDGSGPSLHFAPQADSADGLGAPLPAASAGWPPFTAANRPLAPIGFAIASPLLRLAEGTRSITVHLQFGSALQAQQQQALPGALHAYASGPKGWLGPFDVQGQCTGDRCRLTVQLPASAAALVDHEGGVHLQSFPAGLPVLQFLIKPGAASSYATLMPLRLASVQLVVQAQGLRSLALQSDDGTLDAKKPFLPFGSQPVAGSRLLIGCDEVLNKRATQLRLNLRWLGAPANLSSWYAGYARQTSLAQGVRATVAWAGAGGTGMTSAPLVVLPADGSPVSLDPAAAGTGTGNNLQSAGHGLQQLLRGGNAMTALMAQRQALAQPHLRAEPGIRVGRDFNFRNTLPPDPPQGFIQVCLQQSLLHADYPHDAVKRALAAPPGALNPPYTPKLESLTLDYTAESDVSRLMDASAQAFQQTEVQLHHVDALGTRREHAWLHNLRPWAGEAGAALLPQHGAAGELLVALAPARAGDSFSLLFQVEEGSADPDSTPQTLQWSVLASDAWHPLGAAQGLLDTTQDLRRSGIVAGVLPQATNTDHSLLPAGHVWLRACIAQQPGAACRVVGVHANAVEVMFSDQGNDPQRLANGEVKALPAGSISKLITPQGSIKKVAQPYASFGGALAENNAALAQRAAERLRHRNRAITPWDYERLVLQQFPDVWRAKCIAHSNAQAGDWQAAGQVTVVVLPKLKGISPQDAAAALTPRVDLATLEAIRVHLQARCAPQARVQVRNPRFEALQLQFKVRLQPGYGFNFQRQVLNDALMRHLSPWAFDVKAEPGFNGRVLKSALLDFMEAQAGVQFVTDVALFRAGHPEDLNEVAPQSPDAILVSAAQHLITELPE